MVLAAWSPSGATLSGRHECRPSQVGTHPTYEIGLRTYYHKSVPVLMPFAVAGMQNPNNEGTVSSLPDNTKAVYPLVRPRPRQCAGALIQRLD